MHTPVHADPGPCGHPARADPGNADLVLNAHTPNRSSGYTPRHNTKGEKNRGDNSLNARRTSTISTDRSHWCLDRIAGVSPLAAACALALALAPAVTLAQGPGDASTSDSTESDSADLIEEVIVTGTRITRRDYASTSPISSVDALTIEFSGQPTLEEALNQMPQVQPDFGRSSNNPGDGTSRINLRGLGAERTLVMLNGRRLAPSGARSSVDVNNLPQALIDRVEIITGGASTVYGSDAVAGVVNFITVQNYEGASFESSYYITEEGDSRIWDVNGAWGRNFRDGRGNLTVFLSYLDREPSFASDREVTSVPFQTDFNGNVFPGGSRAIPEGIVLFPQLDFGNGPVTARFDRDSNLVPFVDPDDRYNFAPLNYLQTPLERTSAGVFLTWDLNDRVESYTEATFTRNEAEQTLAPVPAFDFFVTNLDNPFFTDQSRAIAADQFVPVGPGLVGFGFARRMEDVGPRVIQRQRDYLRLVTGLRGALTDRWDFDAWLIYTDGDEVESQTNGVSRSRLAQGFLVDPVTGQCFDPSGGCVPVNLFGPGTLTPEAADYVRAAPFNNVTEREQLLASAYITGSAFVLPAGPVDVALGLEWRSDKVDFEADAAFIGGDALGYLPESAIRGKESVWEVYGEAVLPLLTDLPGARYLGIELGGRYSDYDNAGSVDSWKAGLQWEPLDGIRFRTIFQRSVRAPNLAESFREQVVNLSSFVGQNTTLDPCSASADPAANGNRERCIRQGIPAELIGVYEATPSFPANFITGGNPDLVPETADTFTAGVVFSLPSTPALQLAIDYFDLEVEDTIGSIDATAICFDPANTEDLFCDNIRRDPLTYNVNEVFEPTSNRGRTSVEGIDTQLTWTTDLPRWLSVADGGADLRVNLIWTHLLSKVIQENPASTPLECAGTFGQPCVFQEFGGETYPENRVTSNLLYRSGALNTNLTWRYIGGSDNAIPIFTEIAGLPEPDLAIPNIGATSYFDLSLAYDFTGQVRGVLNVVNLLDEDAPFVADQSPANNVDTTLYDIFGRSYQVSLLVNF